MTHSIGDAANGVVRLTSNTIALVYADPSKAVYWTKPSDWEADLDNPCSPAMVEKRSNLNLRLLGESAIRSNGCMPLKIATHANAQRIVIRDCEAVIRSAHP